MPIRIAMNLANPQSHGYFKANAVVKSAPPRNMPLNAPMIGRIHKAQSGCSSCGKKVA